MRRAVGFVALTMAFAAVATLASSPRVARATRVWGYGMMRLVGGFTPAQSSVPRDRLRTADGLLLDNSATPGPYCPTGAEGASSIATANADQKELVLKSVASSVPDSIDVLAGPAAARCPVPGSAPSRTVRP